MPPSSWPPAQAGGWVLKGHSLGLTPRDKARGLLSRVKGVCKQGLEGVGRASGKHFKGSYSLPIIHPLRTVIGFGPRSVCLSAPKPLHWPFIQPFLWMVGPLQATGQPLNSLLSAGEPDLAIHETLNARGRPARMPGGDWVEGLDRTGRVTPCLCWKKPAIPAWSWSRRAGR